MYWVSIEHYEAVAFGNWWYWVSRGHPCLYILQKVEIWTKDDFIVSRIYRMPIYRTFSYIEEYIVLNLPYLVFRYSQNQWFFCLFSPKILRKFRKFPENSENPWTKVLNNNNNNNNAEKSKKSPKIRRKFLKKKVFFETLISYRYCIVSRKKP